MPRIVERMDETKMSERMLQELRKTLEKAQTSRSEIEDRSYKGKCVVAFDAKVLKTGVDVEACRALLQEVATENGNHGELQVDLSELANGYFYVYGLPLIPTAMDEGTLSEVLTEEELLKDALRELAEKLKNALDEFVSSMPA